MSIQSKINFKALVISLVIALGGGSLSGGIAKPYYGDYLTLNKPIFSPPIYVFPLVWTILYILMAVAAYIVYQKTKRVSMFYVLQLLLNFFWPVLFFNLRLYAIGFVELLLLLVIILLTTFRFFKVSKLAGLLMLPYIIWVSFAGILNYAIWVLN